MFFLDNYVIKACKLCTYMPYYEINDIWFINKKNYTSFYDLV